MEKQAEIEAIRVEASQIISDNIVSAANKDGVLRQDVEEYERCVLCRDWGNLRLLLSQDEENWTEQI